MFCDLVGSTALSERPDPEDLRDVLRAYQNACADLFVPVFFVTISMKVIPATLNPFNAEARASMVLALLMIGVGVAGNLSPD